MTAQPAGAESLPANAPARRALALPGDASMWLFVLGDMVIFGVYIACLIMLSRKAIERQQPGEVIAE